MYILSRDNLGGQEYQCLVQSIWTSHVVFRFYLSHFLLQPLLQNQFTETLLSFTKVHPGSTLHGLIPELWFCHGAYPLLQGCSGHVGRHTRKLRELMPMTSALTVGQDLMDIYFLLCPLGGQLWGIFQTSPLKVTLEQGPAMWGG